MTPPIRIVIADDHPPFSDSLRLLLEIEPDFKVIGQASNAEDAVRRVSELRPDILLLDLKMPLQPKSAISNRGGLDALEAVRDLGSHTKTIFFAAEMDTEEILEAMELGVHGVLLKHSATQMLIESIRSVMSGACWDETKKVACLQPTMQAMREELEKRRFGLTPRELKVTSAIVRHGMTNKDIAHSLKIAENTVKKHISSIFDRLGVSNRLELDHFARNRKLPLKDLF